MNRRPRINLLSLVANVAWVAAVVLLLLPVELKREHQWVSVLPDLVFVVFFSACVMGFVRVLRGYASGRPSSSLPGAPRPPPSSF